MFSGVLAFIAVPPGDITCVASRIVAFRSAKGRCLAAPKTTIDCRLGSFPATISRMKDKATGRGGGAATAVVLVVVLVLLPMLYVLSLGPAVWLVSRGWIGPSWQPGLEKVFAPLEWSVNCAPLVGVPIMRYAELWRAEQPVALPSPPPPPAAL